MAKHQFQTEVSQLLHLIVHSLYSHKEIFLRELISNASDALDKLSYLTLTDEKFKSIPFEPRIEISFDGKDRRTLIVSDTGIGMDEVDLVENLGTIARSGTRLFLSRLSGDERKDSNLIGQFGVGFYSSFMVADKVEVTTKKAGDEQAFKWTSDGRGDYEIEPAVLDGHGTRVVVHLNDEGKEYADRWQIEDLVKKYSNHIAFPIYLRYQSGDEKKGQEEKVDQINSASALWRRPKTELTEKDYKEFYETISHDAGEPLFWTHTRAEGAQEYVTLFYVPKKAPFDLYQADYRAGIKLYVKRVFITDDEKELMPVYLRFLRGVIDSEDLPLNVSREILQQNRILASIKSASVKRLLAEFKSVADGNKELYAEFIEQYNRPLKEGLYSDFANRDALLEIVRFKSSEVDGWTSFADYKARMKPEQKAVYYITGDNEERLRESPLLEAYKRKGIEVLLMADEIDEIVIPSLGKYGDLDLKAINRTGADEALKTEDDKKKEQELGPLLKRIKEVLGDQVKEVRASSRLADSPSCIVADENDPTVQLQQMMKALGQKEIPDFKPILEVNPGHEIVKKLQADSSDKALLEDVSYLLLEQALLVEGAQLKKPAEFVRRLNRVMAKAL